MNKPDYALAVKSGEGGEVKEVVLGIVVEEM
jgi:hypothetical protein